MISDFAWGLALPLSKQCAPHVLLPMETDWFTPAELEHIRFTEQVYKLHACLVILAIEDLIERIEAGRIDGTRARWPQR